jgi:hypothetical protein
MLRIEEMEYAAEIFRDPSRLSEVTETFLSAALEQALVTIHGPSIDVFQFSDIANIDPDSMFDERWGLNMQRSYDREDRLMWIVSASVIPDADTLCTTANTVSSKAVSYRAACYSTLILSAILFESMAPTPEAAVA